MATLRVRNQLIGSLDPFSVRHPRDPITQTNDLLMLDHRRPSNFRESKQKEYQYAIAENAWG